MVLNNATERHQTIGPIANVNVLRYLCMLFWPKNFSFSFGKTLSGNLLRISSSVIMSVGKMKSRIRWFLENSLSSTDQRPNSYKGWWCWLRARATLRQVQRVAAAATNVQLRDMCFFSPLTCQTKKTSSGSLVTVPRGHGNEATTQEQQQQLLQQSPSKTAAARISSILSREQHCNEEYILHSTHYVESSRVSIGTHMSR